MRETFTRREVKIILEQILLERKDVEDMTPADHLKARKRYMKKATFWDAAADAANQKGNAYLADIYSGHRENYEGLADAHEKLHDLKSSPAHSYHDMEWHLGDTEIRERNARGYKKAVRREISQEGMKRPHKAIMDRIRQVTGEDKRMAKNPSPRTIRNSLRMRRTSPFREGNSHTAGNEKNDTGGIDWERLAHNNPRNRP